MTLLLGLVRHPWLAMGAVMGVFALAMFGFSRVPVIFFPPNDRPTFMAQLELPTGTPIQRTERVVQEVEGFIRDHLAVGPRREQGVTNWATFIGQGAPRFILPYTPKQAAPRSTTV